MDYLELEKIKEQEAKKMDKKENDIPPQYEGLPSEVVEELWQEKLYVDQDKTKTEAERRKRALEQIKNQEKANEIRKKLGIPEQKKLTLET